MHLLEQVFASSEALFNRCQWVMGAIAAAGHSSILEAVLGLGTQTSALAPLGFCSQAQAPLQDLVSY